MYFDCLPGYTIPDYPSSFSAENAALPVTWPDTSYEGVIALEKCMEDAADTYISASSKTENDPVLLFLDVIQFHLQVWFIPNLLTAL